MTNQVLLIEDDDALRSSLAQTMELAGFTPIPTNGFVQARRTVRANFNGVVLSDIRMPHQDGFDLLAHARRIDPDLPVILLTGHSDVPTAMRAMKEGAWDYLEKPCSTERLQEVLQRALDHRALVLKTRRIERSLLRNDPAALHFPGTGEATQSLCNALRHAAGTREPVHLHGAPGTGKKQAAYVINRLSSETPAFLRVSFLDPAKDPLGRLEVPAGLVDLSVEHLGKADARQQSHLADLAKRHPGIRLITSATATLAQLGPAPLTDDLASRDQIIQIGVPTLEDRRADLPDIFTALVRQAVRSLGNDMPDIPQALMTQILARPWPGNIQELRAFAMSFILAGGAAEEAETLTLAAQIDAFEKLVLIQTLKRTGGRAIDAAQTLGIPRNTLYDRLARHGLSPRDFRNR